MIIRILILMLISASMLPVFLFGCNSIKNAEKGNEVIPKAPIPPMDASLPDNTETATFALG